MRAVTNFAADTFWTLIALVALVGSLGVVTYVVAAAFNLAGQ